MASTIIRLIYLSYPKGPGGSMSYVVGLPNNSYKPTTNTACVRARLCRLQKGCTRLETASDKVYQLLAHGQWFSPASFITKIGHHDIAEILLKVALNTKTSIISIYLILQSYYRFPGYLALSSDFCKLIYLTTLPFVHLALNYKKKKNKKKTLSKVDTTYNWGWIYNICELYLSTMYCSTYIYCGYPAVSKLHNIVSWNENMQLNKCHYMSFLMFSI